MNDEIEKVSELVLSFILRHLLTKIISDELLLPDTFSCVTYCPDAICLLNVPFITFNQQNV